MNNYENADTAIISSIRGHNNSGKGVCRNEKEKRKGEGQRPKVYGVPISWGVCDRVTSQGKGKSGEKRQVGGKGSEQKDPEVGA